MKFRSTCAVLFGGSLLSILSALANSSDCGFRYPTRWTIQNPTETNLQVDCRVYHGGWSYQAVNEVHFSVPARQSISHSFSGAHNDGLGMIDRNWSCASAPKKMPLMRPDSRGFLFEGCPDSTLVLQENGSDGAADRTIPDRHEVRSPSDSTCPQPSSIRRLHKCNSPQCTWDKYGVNEWEGIAEPLSPSELTQFEFVGVDANLSKDSVLGCLYAAENIGKTLILLSYLPAQEGSFPKFRYRPADDDDFKKMSGRLMQCFSSNPADCPLARK